MIFRNCRLRSSSGQPRRSFTIQPQQIEGIKVRLSALEHQLVELRSTILFQTHEFAIEDRVFNLEVRQNRLAQGAKGL